MRHIEAHNVEGVGIPWNSGLEKSITHSNDVLCRTERSMERLIFFLFIISVLGPGEPCNICECCDFGNVGM